MRNVLSMDLYRLCRSRAVRIGLVLAAVVSFVSLLAVWGFAEMVVMVSEVDPTMAQDAETMTQTLPMLGWRNGVDIGVVAMQFSSILSLAIALVLSVIFINDEQTAGFGKNYLGQLADKSQSVLSKLITTSVIQLLVVLITALTAIGSAYLFYGGVSTGFHVGSFALAMVMRLLMYLAMNAVLVFVALATKSRSASMIVAVVFGIGAAQFGYTVITSALQFMVSRLFGDAVTVPSVAGLIPDGVERMIDTGFYFNPDADVIIRVLAVAAVYLVGFTVLTAIVVRKRDVR